MLKLFANSFKSKIFPLTFLLSKIYRKFSSIFLISQDRRGEGVVQHFS